VLTAKTLRAKRSLFIAILPFAAQRTARGRPSCGPLWSRWETLLDRLGQVLGILRRQTNRHLDTCFYWPPR
jgi:hypothetical protein